MNSNTLKKNEVIGAVYGNLLSRNDLIEQVKFPEKVSHTIDKWGAGDEFGVYGTCIITENFSSLDILQIDGESIPFGKSELGDSWYMRPYHGAGIIALEPITGRKITEDLEKKLFDEVGEYPREHFVLKRYPYSREDNIGVPPTSRFRSVARNLGEINNFFTESGYTADIVEPLTTLVENLAKENPHYIFFNK